MANRKRPLAAIFGFILLALSVTSGFPEEKPVWEGFCEYIGFDLDIQKQEARAKLQCGDRRAYVTDEKLIFALVTRKTPHLRCKLFEGRKKASCSLPKKDEQKKKREPRIPPRSPHQTSSV